MIDGRRVLAVVPARGGSKGLPRKNLRLFEGIPLVGHAGVVAAAVPAIDRAVVSTDDEEIARAAGEYGLAFNGFRPADLSADRVADWPVVNYELQRAEAVDGVRYDIVVMLQPTSPLRRPEHVVETIERLVEGRFDSVWTVSPTDSKHHPLKQLRCDADNRLSYYDDAGGRIIARQQLDALYHRNGVAYAMTRDCILEQQTIKGARAGAVIIEEPMVSIDTEFDLQLCGFLLAQRATR